MDIILMIVFAAAFIFSLVLLITAKNGSKRWLVLFISLVTEIAASAVLMKVFDALPGYGMMPGLHNQQIYPVPDQRIQLQRRFYVSGKDNSLSFGFDQK